MYNAGPRLSLAVSFLSSLPLATNAQDTEHRLDAQPIVGSTSRTAGLWAYDPEAKKAVEILQVREK